MFNLQSTVKILIVAVTVTLRCRANASFSKRISITLSKVITIDLEVLCAVISGSVRRTMICLMKRRLSGTHTQSSAGCGTSNSNRTDPKPPST